MQEIKVSTHLIMATTEKYTTVIELNSEQANKKAAILAAVVAEAGFALGPKGRFALRRTATGST